MSPILYEGLQARLGDFGINAIFRALEVGTSFSDFWSSITPSFPGMTVSTVRREWREAWRQLDWEPMFKDLGDSDAIPWGMYRERTVEQPTSYAYRVHIYGRDLATGRYRSEDSYLHADEPLTKGEAVDIMRSRVGSEGDSPTYDIFTIDVRGAFFRSADQEVW